MALEFGFYDSLNGDRLYNATQFSSIFEGIIEDGVFMTYGDAFAVSEDANMDILVGSGRAWFNYTWSHNDADIGLTVADADAIFDRIDTVVLEVDTTSTVRANSIKIIAGSPAASPVAPTLTNAGTVHQYPLADIYVAAAVTEIVNADITNRVGTWDCKYVAASQVSVDASILYNKLESEFYIWFDNLVDQLTGVQVTNLQDQIDTINSDIAAIADGWTGNSDNWTYSSDDGPTGVLSVDADLTGQLSVGMRVSYVQSQALAAYWTFDVSSAASVGTFTPTNIGTPTYTAGKFSNALTLNGTTDGISIANNSTLRPTTRFTVGAWIKTSSSNAQGVFQSFSANTAYAGFQILVDTNGTIKVITGSNTGTTKDKDYTDVNGLTAINDGNFHYVVVTYNNKYLQIYVDGKLDIGEPMLVPTYAGTNYIKIGCLNVTGTNVNFFSGQIDDLFVLNDYALGGGTIYDQYMAAAAQGVSSVVTTKMGIVTAVGAWSGSAMLLTVYHGNDFSLSNASITTFRFAQAGYPFGFPPSEDKWTMFGEALATFTKTSPTGGTAYNTMDSGTLVIIDIPIGSWRLELSGDTKAQASASPSYTRVEYGIAQTISSPNPRLMGIFGINAGVNTGSVLAMVCTITVMHNIRVSTKTKHYIFLTGKSNGTLDYISVDNQSLRLICEYL